MFDSLAEGNLLDLPEEEDSKELWEQGCNSIDILIQASEASYGIITRLKKAVVCSTTPPRSLVLPGPKGVQSVLGGCENVFKGSWTSPS